MGGNLGRPQTRIRIRANLPQNAIGDRIEAFGNDVLDRSPIPEGLHGYLGHNTQQQHQFFETSKSKTGTSTITSVTISPSSSSTTTSLAAQAEVPASSSSSSVPVGVAMRIGDGGLDSHPVILPIAGFRTELGGVTGVEPPVEYYPVALEQCFVYSRFYHMYFASEPHTVYLGGTHVEPILLCIRSGPLQPQDDKVLAYMRTKRQDYFLLVANARPDFQLRLIFSFLRGFLTAPPFMHRVTTPSIVARLEHMESRLLGAGAYKFGVVYCKQNQTDERDMFSNQHGSPRFQEFLQLLGDMIELDSWDGFRGGLDTHSNATGTHTVFTNFHNFDILFHVSTLLPYDPKNRQQVARKRHIGNDICVLVFVDSLDYDYEISQLSLTSTSSPASSSSSPVETSSTDISESHSSNSVPPSEQSIKKRNKRRRRKDKAAGGSTPPLELDPPSIAPEPAFPPPFNPTTITSKFNHVYIVIQVDPFRSTPHQTMYRIGVACKDLVLPHGPVIRSDGLYPHGPEFRDFLLSKLINAERAAYCAPGFQVSRTRRIWLEELLNDYL